MAETPPLFHRARSIGTAEGHNQTDDKPKEPRRDEGPAGLEVSRGASAMDAAAIA